MRIKVRTPEGVHLWLPVPIGMALFIMDRMPERFYAKMVENMPIDCEEMVARAFIKTILQEVRHMAKTHKGLEVIHVEDKDGTYVSIRL